MHIPSKLPDVGTTIFTVMSALANEHSAINLSQGFPDFSCPEELIESVHRFMREGYNQYPPMSGIPQLRQAIADKYASLYQTALDADTEVTVTSGATEALFCAITALVNPGDEVIIFDPAYDAYEPVIQLSGGITRRIKLSYPDYAIDWDQVKACINAKTRLIILNNPHNPTGSILTSHDIQNLQALVSNTPVFLLADEVYEHIVFDGAQHQSLLRFEDLRTRSFVVSSFGKTYHMTGWKIGYCIAPPEMSTEFRKIHQFNTFTTCTPMQYALAEFLQYSEYYRSLGEFYQNKRNHFLDSMKPSRFKALPCHGTYFQLMSYADITDQQDIEFARKLTTESGIASIPVSVFYGDGCDEKVLRFCFAKDTKTLNKAAEILCKI
ncbi:MAG TPA: methionine aminotransferase [Gammaproteobacteria bacterium]|nr:methionine aminotransferase [Gammaproteobacteria bacterium]